ncbi:hypothetical protein [Kitasatospora sp. NPDC097643]
MAALERDSRQVGSDFEQTLLSYGDNAQPRSSSFGKTRPASARS